MKKEKFNRSIEDVGGEVLVVSQFTLYADCKKGNRPSFTQAGSPAEAERLYEYFFRGVSKRIWQSRAWYFWSRNESITRK